MVFLLHHCHPQLPQLQTSIPRLNCRRLHCPFQSQAWAGHLGPPPMVPSATLAPRTPAHAVLEERAAGVATRVLGTEPQISTPLSWQSSEEVTTQQSVYTQS